MVPDSISYFGRTNFRRGDTLFGIKQADRLSHVYMLGKTGVGKSALMETLARQDLVAGRGFALVDPHGDLVERVTNILLHVLGTGTTHRPLLLTSVSLPRIPTQTNE